MSILDKAADAIDNRQAVYDHPSRNYSRLAALWEPIIGVKLTPLQVVLCMNQVKVARLMNGYHEDSVVDIAGYARVMEMLTETEPESVKKEDNHGPAKECGTV